MRLFPLLLLGVSLTAQAEVYRCQRADRVIYTDKPCNKGATPATLPDINFVGTPGASRSEKALAKSWDERVNQGRKSRAKADAAWVDEHTQKQAKAERVRSGLNQRKVTKGMTPDQVREILGDPDAQSLQEGRENITIWSFNPKEGPQHTVSFRDGEVNSVTSRKGNKKKKK